MNRKERETDFTIKELPKTRKAQFKDLAIRRFTSLLKTSLLETVFLMPLFVSIVLFYIFYKGAKDYNQLFTVILVTGGSFVITIPISYIGWAGVYHSLKQMCWREGEYSASSFFIGLKEEGKRGFLIGLIVGISVAITLIGSTFLYGQLGNINGWIIGVGIALLFVFLTVIEMMSKYMLSEAVFYNTSFSVSMKNSFIFTLMRFPINLLFIVIFPGIFIASISIFEISAYICMGLMVFFNAFGSLIWILNSMYAFDKYINKEYYPDYYLKGLYKGE